MSDIEYNIRDREALASLDRIVAAVPGAAEEALKAVAETTRTTGQRYLAERVPGATEEHKRKRHGIVQSYGKPVDGILYKVDGAEANVNILGDFRLKFFERGTEARYTKQRIGRAPAYRGLIRPSFFFTTAQKVIAPKIAEISRIAIDTYLKQKNAL